MKFLINLFVRVTTFLIFILSFSSSIAQREPDSTKSYLLGEVVVTSSKNNIIKTTSVIEIGSDKLNLLGGSNIAKALSNETGLIITTTSKNESKIYLRGFDQADFSIFLDGVPIYQPFDGLVDLSNLPINAVNKITVSKGMSSILYGANSMGGSINLISAEPTKLFSANAAIETGSVNKFSTGLNGTINNFYYSFNGSYSSSTGFNLPSNFSGMKFEDGGKRNNSQFKNLGGIFKVELRNFNNFDIAYSLLMIDNNKGIPVDIYVPNPRFWKFTQWKKSVNNLILQTNYRDMFTIKGNFFYEKFYNVLDSYDDASYQTQTKPFAFHSVYDDYSFGFNLTSSINLFQTSATRVYSSLRQDTHREQGNFNQPFKQYKASNLSMGIEQDISLPFDLFAVVGIGYDNLKPIEANGGNLRSSTSSLNGNAGLSYAPTENLKFHINISNKNRFPTLKEFYNETIGRDVANPLLENEHAVNSEAGVAIKILESSEVIFALFNNNVENLIQNILLSGGLRQYQNIGNVSFRGIEISSINKFESLRLNLNYTYLSSENNSENAKSEIIEYRPKHKISLAGNYDFAPGTNAGIEFSYKADEYGISSLTNQFIKMPEGLMIDLNASQIILEDYTVYLRVNNLLDKYFESEFGYPQPGIEFLAGVKINF